MIIELLSYENVSDVEACRHHFADLAQANEAEAQIIHTEQLPLSEIPYLQNSGNISAGYLVGIQDVAKFNEKAKNRVYVHLVNIRIPFKETDILITVNHPHQLDQTSSSWGTQQSSTSSISQLLIEILRTFNINDWTLFI